MVCPVRPSCRLLLMAAAPIDEPSNPDRERETYVEFFNGNREVLPGARKSTNFRSTS